jgi:hypothetical protein
MSAGAGYGLGVGAGYQANVAVTVPDPTALVTHTFIPLISKVASDLVDAGRPEAAATARFVLPIVVTAALRARTLRAKSTSAVGETLIGEVQRHLVLEVAQAAARAGIFALTTRLQELVLDDAASAVRLDAVDSVREALDEARGALVTIGADSNPIGELRAALRLLDVTLRVTDLAGNDGPELRPFIVAATAAAAVAIGLRAEEPLAAELPPQLRAVLPSTDPAQLIAIVANHVSAHLGEDVAWITGLLGVSREELIETVLATFIRREVPELDARTVVRGLGRLVEERLVPAIDSLAEPLADLVATPLAVLASDVLPDILSTVELTAGAATLAREQVSALLIGTLGQFLVTALDHCAQAAFDAAEDAIDELIEFLQSNPTSDRSREVMTLVEMSAGAVVDLLIDEEDVAKVLRLAKRLVRAANRLREPAVVVARAAVTSAPSAIAHLDDEGPHHSRVSGLATTAVKEVATTALGLVDNLGKLWLDLSKGVLVKIPALFAEGAGYAAGAVIKGIDALIERAFGVEINLNEVAAKVGRAVAELADAIGDAAHWVKQKIDLIGEELENWIKDKLPGSLFDWIGDVAGFVWDLFTAPVKLALDIFAGVFETLESFFVGIANGACPADDPFTHTKGYLAAAGFQDGEFIDGENRVAIPASLQYRLAVRHLATADSHDLDPYTRAIRAAYNKATKCRSARLEQRTLEAVKEDLTADQAILEARKAGMRADPARLKIRLRVEGNQSTPNIIQCTDGTRIELTLEGANEGFDGSQVGVGTEPMPLYGWERIEGTERDWRWRGVLVTDTRPQRAAARAARELQATELLEWKLRPLPDDVPLPGPIGLPRIPTIPPGHVPGPKLPPIPVEDPVIMTMEMRRRGLGAETLLPVSLVSPLPETQPVNNNRRPPGTSARPARLSRPLSGPVLTSRPPVWNMLGPVIPVRPGIQRLVFTFADGFIDADSDSAAISFVPTEQ